MKILVCGIGSVGERHVRNLIKLGHKDLIFFRSRNRSLPSPLSTDFPVFFDLKEALDEKPDIAFICNPTHLHVPTALECVEAGCHLFIEKPLSHNLEGIEELERVLAQTDKKCMVGYMLRFHPGIKKAKELIDGGRIGNLVYLNSHWGEYLPDWHPWEDYRDSYAAQEAMGGGPLLTLSHDLDLLNWLGGEVLSSRTTLNFRSQLELKCSHGADLLLTFRSGATGHLHVNYFERPASRRIDLIGTEGKMTFDYYRSELTLYSGMQAPENFQYTNFDRNELFLDEVKYFFDAIEKDSSVEPGISESKALLQTLDGSRA